MPIHPASAEGDPSTTTTTTTTSPLEQLRLRLLALVEARPSGLPPDRGWLREGLELTLGDAQTFEHGGRTISRTAILAVVGWLYFRSDRADVVQDFAGEKLARECGLNERTFLTVIAFLAARGLVQNERPSRRRPRRYCFGLLSWARAMGEKYKTVTRLRRDPVEVAPSPGVMPGLGAPSPGVMPGPKGVRTEEEDHHHHAREGTAPTPAQVATYQALGVQVGEGGDGPPEGTTRAALSQKIAGRILAVRRMEVQRLASVTRGGGRPARPAAVERGGHFYGPIVGRCGSCEGGFIRRHSDTAAPRCEDCGADAGAAVAAVG